MSGWYDPVHERRPPVGKTFPHSLTQHEYDTEWKPRGWRLIVIGPTATWRQDWGEWEAIRDIVQNSLDEAEGYQYGYDEQGLWIADKGAGVAVADFLLGPPKLKPEYARGRFGEGMKIAALALLRLGYGVHVNTVRRELWMIFLEQKVNGQVQTLAAMWKPNGTARGTRFHIVGYDGSAFSENFAVNLPRGAILAQVPSPVTQPVKRYNQLIRADYTAVGGLPASVIYSRDIFLQEIVSPFSYNLWGFALAPDRHAPKEEYEMYLDMGRLWAGISSVPLLKRLLPMLTDPPMVRGDLARPYTESVHLVMDRWSMGREPSTGKLYTELMFQNQAHWQKAWEDIMGTHAVLRTETRLDSMVTHLGHTSVSVHPGVRTGLELVIKTDKDIVREMAERLDEAERIPDRELTERQLNNLKLARAIAADFSQVGQVNAGIIPPASDMVARTAGLYEFGTGMIKIHAEMLENASKTLAVMVHELGHHVAYKATAHMTEEAERIAAAGDLTPGHAVAMEQVAARIFRNLHRGDYDDELQDVAW